MRQDVPTALLFDLDGCLVDSTSAITSSLNRALTDLGLRPRPVDELVRFIGPPLVDAVATLLDEEGASADLADELIATYRRHYAPASLELTVPVRGVKDVVAALASQMPLVVVTSKPRPFAVPILQTLGMLGHFVDVHGPSLDDRGETKATTLTRALATTLPAHAPGRTAMIGDRYHDVVAGRAVGTMTIGVTWGVGDRLELDGADADLVIDHPEELRQLLDAPP